MYERKTWFFAAIAASSWSNPCSDRPGGRSSGRCRRIDPGTVRSISASSDGRPRTSIIFATSEASGPMWRWTKRSGGFWPAIFVMSFRAGEGAQSNGESRLRKAFPPLAVRTAGRHKGGHESHPRGEAGRPRSDAARRAADAETRSRPGVGPGGGRGSQLHRHLSAQRRISDEAADGAGVGGSGRRRGSRRGRGGAEEGNAG